MLNSPAPRRAKGLRTETRHRALLLALLILSGYWQPAGAAAAPAPSTREVAGQNAAQTNAELDRILAALNELDTWFGAADRKRIRLLGELKRRDEQVATAAANVSAAKASIADAESALASLANQRKELEAQRQEQAERIVSHLQSAARLDSEDLVKRLLNQEAPDQLERMLRYHSYFTRARIESVRAFEETVIALDSNRQALEGERERLTAEQARQEQEQRRLAAERQERRELIASLDIEVGTKTEQRTRLNGDRERLESLVVELRRRSTTLDGKPFAELRGSMSWPVSGKLDHRYGSIRTDGELTWQGHRFAAEEGVPIKAVYEGRVVFADWLRGYGQLLIVDHGSRYMSLYGSVDGLNKGVGDWVEGGEVIATAGTSGGQPQPGLYFEIRKDGKPEDPARWLRDP